MDRPKCQCMPTCRMPATDGQPFNITHDARPERQAERSRIMSERASAGGKQFHKNHQAADSDPDSIDLGTVDGRRDAINRSARQVMAAGGDASKAAGAIATLIKTAMELDRIAALEDENRELRAIIESNPDLKRKLKAVP